MKGYMLFFCRRYDPYGGWSDFEGIYDSVDSALQKVADKLAKDRDTKCEYHFWEIVDISNLKAVRCFAGKRHDEKELLAELNREKEGE